MPYSDDDLAAWFADFLGATPLQVARMPKKQRDEYRSRAFVKRKVRGGAQHFFNRRREKGLGTYSIDRHVVVDRMDELQRNFLVEVDAHIARDRERRHRGESVRETWACFGEREVFRDALGRFRRRAG